MRCLRVYSASLERQCAVTVSTGATGAQLYQSLGALHRQTPSQLSITLNGHRLGYGDALDQLDASDDLTCFRNQVGGAADEGEEEQSRGKIILDVRLPDRDPVAISVKPKTPFRKVYDAIGKVLDLPANSFHLMYDGDRLGPEDTPKMHEIHEGVRIDFFLPQQGGGSDDADSNGCQIKISFSDGDTLDYALKMNTKFSNVISNVAKRREISKKAFRLQFDGQRLNGDDTPKLLDMDPEGNMVDFFLKTVGGGSDDEDQKPKGDNKLIISIVFGDDEENMTFNVKPTTPFEKLAKVLAERRGIEPNSFRLLFDGQKIKMTDTPKKLGMEADQENQVDFKLEQLGGC